jgi:hypothetical protein
LVVAKDVLPVVAALDDMVGVAGHGQPGFSRHASSMKKK